MPATFTLNWIPNINSKVIGQRAYYRQKNIGGSFSDEGFDPLNDLPVSASSTSITDLLYNTIYEFEIGNVCIDSEDPVFNSNGIIEAIVFKCEPVNVEISFDSVKAFLSSIPADITKIKFLLYTSSDILLAQHTSLVVDNYAETTFANLSSETSYIIKTQYFSFINNQEVISTCTIDNGRLISTDEYPACTMPTSLIVTAVNM